MTTVPNVFLLSLQNAAVTSQDLISRKIKEYNMMRFAGRHISSTYLPVLIVCLT